MSRERSRSDDDVGTDSVVARRNHLLGLWAGKRLGLADQALDRYVRTMVGETTPGEQVLVARVSADFRAAGLAMPDREIQTKVRESYRLAHQQCAETD